LQVLFLANSYIWAGKNFDLTNVPPSAIIQWLFYRSPEFLAMVLPAGMALSACLAMGRFVRESEMTAMRASGAKLTRVFMPLLFAGALVAVANFYVVEYLQPSMLKQARKLEIQIGMLGSIPSFSTNRVLYLKNYVASFGSVQKAGDDTLVISYALLIERPEPDVAVLLSANRARYDRGVWKLQDTTMYRIDKGEVVTLTTKDEVIFNEKIVVDDVFVDTNEDEKTIHELQTLIEATKRTKGNARRYEVALQNKFTFPAACIVFALVGCVCVVPFARNGAFVGLLVCFVIVMLYYNTFVIANQIISKNPDIPASLAAWIPNLAFTLVALIVASRLE